MGEVLYALSPREVVMSLMGAWTFLRDHLPTDVRHPLCVVEVAADVIRSSGLLRRRAAALAGQPAIRTVPPRRAGGGAEQHRGARPALRTHQLSSRVARRTVTRNGASPVPLSHR